MTPALTRFPDPRSRGRRFRRALAGAAAFAAILLGAATSTADSLRIATWNAELSRSGPGLLLRDILSGADPGVETVARTIVHAAPDVILLTGFDWDHDGHALAALSRRISAHGAIYPHLFQLRPNTGQRTGLDLDDDGRLGGAEDSQGYGRFTGHGAMALLSRLPVAEEKVVNLSELLWRDLPGALLVEPRPAEQVLAVQRLSTVGHWDVPLRLPDDGVLRVLAFRATPPVFDGPEDRNGRRNHDEAALWLRYLEGALEPAPPQASFVIVGDANLDPLDGDGRPDALRVLLDHPRLQDPRPKSAGGVEASRRQGGVNDGHRGDPALDTADWDDGTGGPGNLRVDYVLPSADLTVIGTGVLWPVSGDPLHGRLDIGADGTSRHRLVWVDLDLPD